MHIWVGTEKLAPNQIKSPFHLVYFEVLICAPDGRFLFTCFSSIQV